MKTESFPWWAFVARLRRAGDQLILSVPTGSGQRGKAARRWLETGRVERGQAIVQGRRLPEVARQLGVPAELLDALEWYAAQVKARGVRSTDLERAARESAAIMVFSLWERRVKELISS